MTDAAYPRLPVLLVDDESSTLVSMRAALNAGGIRNIRCFSNANDMLASANSEEMGTVLLDLRLPDMSGEELLGAIRERWSEVPIIVITAADDVSTAVRCMKRGAFDYLVKPVLPDRLVMAAKRALSFRELEWENVALKNSLLFESPTGHGSLSDIVTQDAKMMAIFRYVRVIAPTSQPDLITG